MRKLLFIALMFLLIGSACRRRRRMPPVGCRSRRAAMPFARGTPYTFFNRPADPSKLLIFFEGGGACWNDATCAPNSGLFDEVVEGGEAANYSQGIFDPANPENPLAGYSTVFVSYCTGDYHLGTKTVDYSTGTVQHKGYVDATAALDWTFANYPRPKAGRGGRMQRGRDWLDLYAPTIARRYRSAALTQFGDAGVGVINPGWGGFDVWGVRNRHAAPDQFVSSLYTSAARSYPRDRFGQYTTYNDSVQTNYYSLTGAVIAWPLAMDASLTPLQRYHNFSDYVAPGGDHCLSVTPGFYSEAVNGVRFRDWFAALVAHQDTGDVHCTDC